MSCKVECGKFPHESVESLHTTIKKRGPPLIYIRMSLKSFYLNIIKQKY